MDARIEKDGVEVPISDRAVRIFCLLSRFAGGAEEGTFRGKKELAEACGCGTTSIDNAIRELVSIGALTIEERRAKNDAQLANGYVVHSVPAGTPRQPVASPPAATRHPTRAIPDSEPLSETGTAIAVPEGPPKLEKVGLRDIAFDALAAVCNVAQGSPRMREVATALHGARGREGIRSMGWGELRDRVEPGEEFESALAELIRTRAAEYKVAMPGAMLTPLALAKWWVDVKGVRHETGAERAARVALDAMGADE